jgi:hypothetical protein
MLLVIQRRGAQGYIRCPDIETSELVYNISASLGFPHLDSLTGQIRRGRESAQLLGLDSRTDRGSYTAAKQSSKANLDITAHLEIPECHHGIDGQRKVDENTEAYAGSVTEGSDFVVEGHAHFLESTHTSH